MKRIVITLATTILFLTAKAQEDKKVDFSLYGFVRNDFYLDSYRGLGAAKEQFYLIPKYEGRDKYGNDINEQFSANLLSIITRFGFNLKGPDIFNAKSVAKFETDFLGVPGTQPDLLRIRHAFILLNWEKTSLTVGQDWHPFFTKKNYPKMVGINTGAPFNPFSRAPQVRFEYYTGAFTFTGVALYELQFPTFGPSGASSDYQRNAVTPEWIGGIEFLKNGFRLGAMVDFKTIKPRLTTDSLIVSDELIMGLNYVGYAQYKTEKLEINAKAIYGGLTSHMVLQGGFGVSDYDTETGQEKYTPYNMVSTYLNAVYGKKLKVGGFVGYAKNLGTTDPLYNFGGEQSISTRKWGRMLNITTMYRGSASLMYNIKNVSLLAEYEYTVANYGEGSIKTSDGLFETEYKTANKRLNLAIAYNF